MLVCTSTLAVALLAATAASGANPVRVQQQRAKRVEARVNQLGLQLEQVVQQWDGERAALQEVDARLRVANTELLVARRNLHAAQHRLEQRLVDLYVSPPPDAIDVFVGATSLSDLINRIEATQSFSKQDRAIAAAAIEFRAQIKQREVVLHREKRNRTRLIASLAVQHAQIERGIAAQQHLLASIHQTIQTLQAQQAARERRLAALARARIAREVAAARERAAAQAVQPQPTVALPSPPQAPAQQPDPQPAPGPGPSPAAPPAPAPAPAPTTHASAASIAARYLGVPYVWGGASPSGFDCSGLVMYVYAQLGISLPHYTVSQWDATTPIAVSDLQPGDLVFFDGLSHVGIYIGNGQFIHAPHTGTVVQIGTLAGYWSAHLDGARRVP